MRFDSINILNYRQYKNLDISFPKAKENDLHIIIASNGIGKTNMLNAINWCLYDDEPHLGDSKDSLSICNYKALEEAKNQGLSEVVVSVTINVSTDREKIIFERTSKVITTTKFKQPSTLKVIITPVSGDSEILQGEEAQEIINKHLPRKIRQYFFFDGEQLHNYFGKGRDTSHVKDSIYEIAQVNVVSNTYTHLKNVIETYRQELSKQNPEIEKYTSELKDKEKEKEKLKDDVDNLEESIHLSQDRIADLRLKISGTEQVAADNDHYEENNERLKELNEIKKRQEDKLRDLVKKYYILLMMYETNLATSKYIESKCDKGVLPPSIDIKLIEKSLKDHECVICKNYLNDTAQKFLQSLLDKYEVSTDVSHKLVEIKNDVYNAVESTKKYKEEIGTLFEEIRKTDGEIEDLTKLNEELYKKISNCSAKDEIKSWIDERNNHQELININNQKIGAYKTQIDQLEKYIEDLTGKIESATSSFEKCEKIKEQLNFATEAQKIVSDIEKEMTTEVRERMEEEIKNIFNDLIWKKDTYGRIELSDNYSLKLFHKHTGDSCLGSCSAAERELLALAFTIALHQVSGHEGLLFIDTPVGRVSDENRENFARSLVKVSKNKQLILAFTPSEFSDEISKYFNPTIYSSFNRMVSGNEKETYQEV